MREILFRGKRLDNGEWIEGASFNTRNEAFYICPTVSDITYGDNGKRRRIGCWYAVDLFTVGQYTGLTDKNGKRIFEGDICQHEKTGRTISVSWHGTMAGYVWSKRIEDSHLFDFGELFRVHDKYAVIGNIHDNPELLEESK